MQYQEALDYLYSFLDSEAKLPRRPAEFNLPRTKALLHAAGDPQQHFHSVVIAGTKGKGSTSVMLESILRTAGYRTGLWTSPHLHSYRERMQVDRQLISRETLAAQVTWLKLIVEQFDSEEFGGPTVFELGFVLALRWFAESAVELAVLEVGLGGRYDNANAVTPILSVITSISYDHMQTLGSTLGEIAYQKAGIAKPGVPLLTIPQHPEAMRVIEQVTAQVGAPLVVAGSVPAPPTPLLPGTFQRENARLAVGAAQLLREQGLQISDQAVTQGLAIAAWPGRFEIVVGTPTIVLDGAHNGDSAQRLVESLGERFGDRGVVLVFGTTQDKDVASMFKALLPRASMVVLTHSVHPRAQADLTMLAEQIKTHGLDERTTPIFFAEDVPKAVELAQHHAAPTDIICVTGSLYVVAAAREALGLANERD